MALNQKEMIDLTTKLAKAEHEDDVEDILKRYGMLDIKHWKYFGDNENNYSTIGNQQSSGIGSLTEKLINSCDAVLMRLCLEKGESSEGPEAPKNMSEALEKFIGIPDGDVSNLDQAERTRLAQEIMLVSTGKDRKTKGVNPCYTVIDTGEGQSPRNFATTFLSEKGKNKLSIPFVHGKFNMGGTGALQFCGNKKYQLIISRRHEKLVQCPDDELWGVTLIRKQSPREGQRNSVFTYLAPDGEIISFRKASLKLKPNLDNIDEPKLYSEEMTSGTYIKMYNYEMKTYGSRNSTMSGGLTDGLNIQLARPAIPIRLIEGRNVKGRSLAINVTGFEVRLQTSGKAMNNIEAGFPSNATISVEGQQFGIKIYAFKKDKAKYYRRTDGSIVFCFNGQTQGYFSDRFFTRKNISLDYIKSDIFVVIDCSKLDVSHSEDLFMNNREKLRESRFRDRIIDELESVLGGDKKLKEMKEKRRKEALESKVSEDKLLVDKIKGLIDDNPAISALFGFGSKVPVKGDSGTGDEDKGKSGKQYEGKKYPTFFRIVDTKEGETPTYEVAINRKKLVIFETDANNDFLTRDDDQGFFKIVNDKGGRDSFNYSLNDGVFRLMLNPLRKLQVGDVIEYNYNVGTAVGKMDFKGAFNIKLIKAEKVRKNTGRGGTKKKKSAGVALPKIVEVYKDDLMKEDMGLDSVIKITKVDNGVYDYFVNMDNPHLAKELLKEKTDSGIASKKEIYKIVSFLYALSLVNELDKDKEEPAVGEEDPENCSVEMSVYSATKAMAPMLFSFFDIEKELKA